MEPVSSNQPNPPSINDNSLVSKHFDQKRITDIFNVEKCVQAINKGRDSLEQQGLVLKTITDADFDKIDPLVQEYEKEFAPLTKSTPKADGRYELDTPWTDPNCGIYLMKQDKVIGFCTIEICDDNLLDVGEFFIIKSERRKGYGKEFAHAIFAAFPSRWQVREIEAAKSAQDFWLITIREYTNNDFENAMASDDFWGNIHKQTFNSFSSSPQILLETTQKI
ncbi:GNAT family N-acetyltransferase [Candidatus Neptunichlamydia sp. REUL1]|uniref:GNAT family N-acetyltransferase n=1 Tax=Candidatus Neptunichlamydia sp. REUL1 TaxID=3064277 RepID=UPI00292D3783|nr:GNAT family N-acetyltransferase [Candidatus Neptunochlamydia sp. REUL1]